MESALRRLVRHLFAKAPKLYLATLKALRRGSHEKRMYLSIIRKGDVVIDVGANVGYFTKLFSDLVGPSGEVHAFEPLPSTFDLLSRNVRKFPAHRNVSLNCLALGDQNQKTILYVPDRDHVQAALTRHRDGSWIRNQIRAVNVEMIRLDRYAERLPKIDFVKCDAEGAELLVLRGGESTLRRCRPKMFLEIEERWTSSFGWTAADVIRFLGEIGYLYFYGLGNQGLQIETAAFPACGILCTWEKMKVAADHLTVGAQSKLVLRRLYRQGRGLLARSLQSLPISSRMIGPPKGFYSSFGEYARAVDDRIAREWLVLRPETFALQAPVSGRPEEVQIYQPLKYESPGFGLYRVRNGRFHRDARAVLTLDDRLLASFSAWMGRGPQDNWLFGKIRLGSLRRFSGKSLLLIGDRNYYHFLIEQIPRVRLASQAGFRLNDFDHIIMFSPIHDSQKVVCERLGVDRARIIPLEEAPHIECEELYFTTGPWNYGRSFVLMAREFLLGLCRHSDSIQKRRIYISRERCSHGRITNEEDLLRELSGAGFEKVVPELLSFDEQAALFKGAECIVGAHGAGLTNLIFSPPGCRIIEFRNPTYDQGETYQARGGNIFWRLSQFLDFEYHAVFAAPDGTACKAPEGAIVESVRLPNLTVDVNSLISFLAALKI